MTASLFCIPGFANKGARKYKPTGEEVARTKTAAHPQRPRPTKAAAHKDCGPQRLRRIKMPRPEGQGRDEAIYGPGQ